MKVCNEGHSIAYGDLSVCPMCELMKSTDFYYQRMEAAEKKVAAYEEILKVDKGK